ncbi:phage tail assembly protein T [Citrobacter braakii]|uniref:phage tail assembly protein T n=1 Tax=Citrobacter braakii TaxID=57706 RepID=UPI003D710BE1
MSLALRMGRTLSELRQSMTASELLMWIEFDRQSPVGDVRGDIQAAQIVSAVYGSQGVKVPLEDAILRWDGGEQSAPEDPFAGLEEALSVAAG